MAEDNNRPRENTSDDGLMRGQALLDALQKRLVAGDFSAHIAKTFYSVISSLATVGNLADASEIETEIKALSGAIVIASGDMRAEGIPTGAFEQIGDALSIAQKLAKYAKDYFGGAKDAHAFSECITLSKRFTFEAITILVHNASKITKKTQ